MIKAVLLDVGGVVYVGDRLLPGALAAIERLRAAGLGLRYITNTTSQPLRVLLGKLRGLGVTLAPEELFMPAVAARRFLLDRNLSPFLLVAPALEEDFAGVSDGPADAVVVGDAGQGFTYPAMNRAFRLLQDGAEFLALARNRYYRDSEDRLSLDAGPYVTALEYASQRRATLFGKPSEAFFLAAVASLGCRADQAVMIGDDAEMDVAGAVSAGLHGILVRSGKYRTGDENSVKPSPTLVAADLSAAAERILAHSVP